DVEGVDSFIGAGTINATPNSGHLTVVLKPHGERKSSGQEVLERLRNSLSDIRDMTVSLQLAQDIQIGSRASRTQYQYTLIDADKAELEKWAPRLVEKLQTYPSIEDVTSD